MDNRTCACAYVMWRKYAAIATKTYLGVIPKDLINAYISRMIAYLRDIDYGDICMLKIGSKELELIKQETNGVLPHKQMDSRYEYNFWREEEGFFIAGSDLMYFKNGECVDYALGNRRSNQWVRCGLYFICFEGKSAVDGSFYCMRNEKFVKYNFPIDIKKIYGTFCSTWMCITQCDKIFLTDFNHYPPYYNEIRREQMCEDDLEYVEYALEYNSDIELYSEASHVSDCEYFSEEPDE